MPPPPSRSRRPPGAPRGRAAGGTADRKKGGGGRPRAGASGVLAFRIASAAIAAAVALVAGRGLV